MAGNKAAAADAAAVQVDEAGRLSVPLGGADYLLRPSYEAIVAIERATMPLISLAQSALHGTLQLEDMAIIVTETMKAQGASMEPDDPARADYIGANPEKVGALIYEAGGPAICARLIVLLGGAINGGYTAEGEAKAAKRNQTA